MAGSCPIHMHRKRGLSLADWELLQWLSGNKADERKSFRIANGYPRFPFISTHAASQSAWFLIRAGYVSKDMHGYYRLTDTGLKVASETVPPDWVAPALPPLLDVDINILGELADRSASNSTWVFPRELGASSSSMHSNHLRHVLLRYGYVEARPVGGDSVLCRDDLCPRPTIFRYTKKERYQYRITDAGLAFLVGRSELPQRRLA